MLNPFSLNLLSLFMNNEIRESQTHKSKLSYLRLPLGDLRSLTADKNCIQQTKRQQRLSASVRVLKVAEKFDTLRYSLGLTIRLTREEEDGEGEGKEEEELDDEDDDELLAWDLEEDGEVDDDSASEMA